jgi:general stress protein 26
MNSIDKNQPEDNTEHLSGKKAIQKIKELSEGQSCFFCTEPVGVDRKGSRPMSVQKTDDDGTLWLLSPDDSFTVAEINADPRVRLFFKGSSHSDFLMLNGNASLSKDKAKIKELWQPVMKTWFTEGEDDPRITVIGVKVEDGYYWDTKHGMMVAGIKMLIGAVTGKTLDDSVQGELNV